MGRAKEKMIMRWRWLGGAALGLAAWAGATVALAGNGAPAAVWCRTGVTEDVTLRFGPGVTEARKTLRGRAGTTVARDYAATQCDTRVSVDVPAGFRLARLAFTGVGWAAVAAGGHADVALSLRHPGQDEASALASWEPGFAGPLLVDKELALPADGTCESGVRQAYVQLELFAERGSRAAGETSLSVQGAVRAEIAPCGADHGR